MDFAGSIAAKPYQAALQITQPSPEAAGIGKDLSEMTKNFVDVLQNGEQAAKDAVVGKADPHTLVHSLAQTQLAVETVVTVRDKLVEAYQEILRMPV